MTTIEQLAEFVAGVHVGRVPAGVTGSLRLHLFDTLVAGLAGGRKDEAAMSARLADGVIGAEQVPVLGLPVTTSAPMAALLSCIAVRCTEIDDIHLSSCTTPGSIVVPTVLALAHRKPRVDGNRFLAAMLAGYEVSTRFGRAADGPLILYSGIWPTYLASALGAAAAAVSIIDLSVEQTAHALATAVTLTCGTSARISGLSSRWLTLGCGVRNGITAAMAAGQGFRGGLDLLGTEAARHTQVTGLRVEPERLVAGLGSHFEAEHVSIKPYCAAKQTMSALCAFIEILDRDRIDPERIDRVLVAVPTHYSKMIDHPEPPHDAIGSIVSVQYQLALAAFHPDKLTDTHRMPIYGEPRFKALMEKIVVEADEGLDRYYPEMWPARVRVSTRDGRSDHELLFSKGDPPDCLSWEEEVEKAARVLGRDARIDALALVCRRLGETADLEDLLAALEELASAGSFVKAIDTEKGSHA